MDFQAALTALTLGLLATTSPCVLPLYPGYLAYLSGGQDSLSGKRGRYFLGFFVLAGVLTMMVALGGVIAALSVSVGRALSIIIPLANLAILVLGILLIVNINPFKTLPQIQVPVISNTYINAFLYGMLYGPIALPCSGPLVVGIFAYSLTAGEALSKLWIFLWFGIGFGMPLLLLSFLSGALQRTITRFFARHSRVINLVSGILLVGIAIYDFTVNFAMIRAFFIR
jgi:cytochrome c-type biogenesis protein